MSKKKKSKKYHCDYNSFFLDDVLKQVKSQKKEKKNKVGLTV